MSDDNWSDDKTSVSSVSSIDVDVVYALPEHQQCIHLRIGAGTTAAELLRQVIEQKMIVLDAHDQELAIEQLPTGVYGELVDAAYPLRDGDRLEVYRPLLRDPKERRRQLAADSVRKR